MKKLFVTLILAACVVTQANGEPTWVKDMQVVHCEEDGCTNLSTGEEVDSYAVEGYSVMFPIEEYSPERVKEMAPEVLEWVRINGLPVTVEDQQ